MKYINKVNFFSLMEGAQRHNEINIFIIIFKVVKLKYLSKINIYKIKFNF